MNEVRLTLSRKQWEFLAVLEALGEPASIHLVGNLAPLLPGPLFDLIGRAEELGWIVREGKDHFAIGTGLPQAAKNKLLQINNLAHMSELLDTLKESKLENQVNPLMMIRLLERSRRYKESAELQVSLAEQALRKKREEAAWGYLKRAIDRLYDILGHQECRASYVSAVLELFNLSFALGKNLSDLGKHLNRAQEIARSLGDRRSIAILNMQIGQLYYISGCHDDALAALSVGLREVEELGDEDITTQSAGFIGRFYYIQGMFKDALLYLERADQPYRGEERVRLFDPTAPLLLGHCLTYLGHFHRAIGSLGCNWRLAKERSQHGLATTLRAYLGTVLLLIGKGRDASRHLEGAAREAATTKNALALYTARVGTALKNMYEGRAELAYEVLSQAIADGAPFGLIRLFSSPWILEMLFEFERLGFQPIPELTHDQIREKIWKESNIHLKGVALRIRAEERQARGEDSLLILTDLKESQELLEESGDRLQLSKTIVQIARFELANDNREEAQRQAQMAWKVLGGYAETFFPHDLRYLLEFEGYLHESENHPQKYLEWYMEWSDAVFPNVRQNEILSQVVVELNRLFRAERGGLFWFPKGKPTKKPKLRAACNLTELDVMNKTFQPSLAFILKAFQDNRPILVRGNSCDFTRIDHRLKAVLCLPVEVRGKTRGVLYHDNSYLENCFDFLNMTTIRMLLNHISIQVERVLEHSWLREERDKLLFRETIAKDSYNDKKLVFQSQAMTKLMKLADKVARSDSTVLILGETGVGKELLARHLHVMSTRHDKPFIVVDATSIPSGLVESELFGHEKGAFTGADRQKRGRLELADHGTLFIDEVGEIPKQTQAKLLRAIQERSFSRLGGTSTLHSDFRLIVATNHDLAADVVKGHFREDLYYRLNVINLHLPPLRERIEDVPLLARHFLRRFENKYAKSQMALNSKTETMLMEYDWPGNVRELENVIERAVLLSNNEGLEMIFSLNSRKKLTHPFSDNPTLDEIQRRYINHVLERTNGRIGGPRGAAELLGMPRTTLYARLKKLGLR